jgi:hypothetical protein
MNLPSLQVCSRNSHRQPATPSRSQRTQQSGSRQNARFAPFASNNLRTLFPVPKLQPSPFQSFRDSFTRCENITPAFPVTSTLFIRSFTQERKSTPLFSIACARFCRYVGVWQRSSEGRAKVHGPFSPVRAAVPVEGSGVCYGVGLQSNLPEGKLAP